MCDSREGGTTRVSGTRNALFLDLSLGYVSGAPLGKLIKLHTDDVCIFLYYVKLPGKGLFKNVSDIV